MTEYISLPLAKEIAERYERLGIKIPYGEHYTYLDVDGNELPPDAGGGLIERIVYRYTAAEIFDALPVGTTVTKTDNGYAVEHRDFPEARDVKLERALCLMLSGVLDERIREEGK